MAIYPCRLGHLQKAKGGECHWYPYQQSRNSQRYASTNFGLVPTSPCTKRPYLGNVSKPKSSFAGSLTLSSPATFTGMPSDQKSLCCLVAPHFLTLTILSALRRLGCLQKRISCSWTKRSLQKLLANSFHPMNSANAPKPLQCAATSIVMVREGWGREVPVQDKRLHLQMDCGDVGVVVDRE